jgi:hypothetical protein
MRGKKLTHNYIKDFIKKYNYELLSPEYKNATTKLEIKCNKGHLYKVSWNDFQQGNRCPICFGTPKKNIEAIIEFTRKIGYVLISTEYINTLKKLEFKCPEKHIFEVSWNNFSGPNGSRCPICWYLKNRGSNHGRWKGGISYDEYCDIFGNLEFKDIIKNRDGYKCLNPYCNSKYSRLSVHHIDYNKKNCDKENLITLCISCNSKANTNRKWHKSWYQAIMYRRYNIIYKKEK